MIPDIQTPTNALQTPAVADAIIAAINRAWGNLGIGTLKIEEDSEPRTFQELPFVNLKALEVKLNPKGPNAGVVSVDYLYRYDIILAFPVPPAMGNSAGKSARMKSHYASLLIGELQKGDGFGGVANLPYVTGVDFRDRSPRFENAECTLRVTFECHSQANYFGD